MVHRYKSQFPGEFLEIYLLFLFQQKDGPMYFLPQDKAGEADFLTSFEFPGQGNRVLAQDIGYLFLRKGTQFIDVTG